MCAIIFLYDAREKKYFIIKNIFLFPNYFFIKIFFKKKLSTVFLQKSIVNDFHMRDNNSRSVHRV